MIDDDIFQHNTSVGKCQLAERANVSGEILRRGILVLGLNLQLLRTAKLCK